MDKKIFDNFFELYSENVDNADKNSYFWKLSDKIILEIIKKEILNIANKDSIIFDAGGGSGCWTVKMSNKLKANFVIYDRSEHMLKKAKINIKHANLQNKVKIICGDLINIKKYKTGAVDFIVSIYSPISFVYDYQKAFSEMYRILKPGGKIIIMAHGFYNALYSKINNYFASVIELNNLSKKHIVKWSKSVPDLITYSKESISKELIRAGFLIENNFGIPVFVQPGLEDFDSTNKSISKISEYLRDKEIFNFIFNLEMKYNSLPEVINRGMNIFILAKK